MSRTLVAPRTFPGYTDPRYQEWPAPLRLMARTCDRWLTEGRDDSLSVMAALYDARACKSFRRGGA